MADDTPIRTAIIGYGLSGRIFHAPFVAANPRLVYGLDGQEPALVAGASPSDADFGLTPEDHWGTLGAEGSDSPPARAPTERGDYAGFYADVAATIRNGAPPPVDPGDALAALRIIAEAHAIAGI